MPSPCSRTLESDPVQQFPQIRRQVDASGFVWAILWFGCGCLLCHVPQFTACQLAIGDRLAKRSAITNQRAISAAALGFLLYVAPVTTCHIAAGDAHPGVRGGALPGAMRSTGGYHGSKSAVLVMR